MILFLLEGGGVWGVGVEIVRNGRGELREGVRGYSNLEKVIGGVKEGVFDISVVIKICLLLFFVFWIFVWFECSFFFGDIELVYCWFCFFLEKENSFEDS